MPYCPCQRSETSDNRTTRARRSWEGTPAPDPKIWLASAVLSGLAAVALGVAVNRFPTAQAFFVEDGPIETAQATLLLGIGVLFAIAFLRSAGSRAIFCLAAAYGCIFALTREIPRCGSAFMGGELCLTGSWKGAIVLAASVVGLLALLARPVDWLSVLRLSNLRWTWPIVLVIGLLVAAEGLEHLIYYSEIEEFLELVAYLHLAVMAVTILRQTARS